MEITEDRGLSPDERQKSSIELLRDALDKQLGIMAEKISNSRIVMDDGSDKTFDRLMVAMVKSRDIAENIHYLNGIIKAEKHGEEGGENDSADRAEASGGKKGNPLEERAKATRQGSKGAGEATS